MTIYNRPRPLRVGFATNAETFVRMADAEADMLATEDGRFRFGPRPGRQRRRQPAHAERR